MLSLLRWGWLEGETCLVQERQVGSRVKFEGILGNRNGIVFESLQIIL